LVTALAKEVQLTAGFGKRLKALRTAARMTQERLAELADMQVGNIGRLESGGRQPSWETVARLAKALKVSTDDFLPEGK
jgi:transcriptional regulator with XRE-family HTH domain